MIMTATKDIALVISLALSVVSLVLLFGVTWYFQSSLDLLEHQVEYDRELLFNLQKQINDKGIEKPLYANEMHDAMKRQTEQNCQCKDGSPGPKGPPGSKGETGVEGKQGRKGDTGPPGPRGDVGDQGLQGNPGPIGPSGDKGEIGDRGPRGQRGATGLRGPVGQAGIPGTKGSKGEQGAPGPQGNRGQKGDRGDSGDRGPRGFVGDTGLRGSVGEAGNPGAKGAKGDQGPIGLTGNKGDPGLRGLKGEMGHQGNKGEKGDSGSAGPTGLTGPKGVTGQKGMKGDKEERNGGTVYVRWGHDQCPSTAQLVYSGRAGGPRQDQGGGSNPQCLPLNPSYLRAISGPQHRGYMYGAEYETNTDSNSHVHGVDDTDVPCAVCHVSKRTAVYMVPAKYTCPTGWTREYYGYLMSSQSRHRRTVFTCMDTTFKSVHGSASDRDSFLFYFVEGICGSLPCPPYSSHRELSCAVCTK